MSLQIASTELSGDVTGISVWQFLKNETRLTVFTLL